MTEPYLSHPVRRRRRDPAPDVVADLVVEPEAGAADAVASAVRDLDGVVRDRLASGALRVDLPEPAIAALCERSDLVRVETANTLGLGLDDGA